MRTRRFLLLPLLALACSHAPAPAEAPAADPTAAIRALADSHAQGLLRLDPLLATMVGDHRYDDRLPDTLTDAGIAATRKLNEDTRAQLQRIPRSALSGEDALTWEVLDDMTRTALDGLAFGDPLIPLDHNNALAIQMPVLGSGEGMHPFQTVADYDHFLARIGAFDQWVNAAIANMRRGISAGYTQPKVVIQRAIPQLEAQIVARPEDSAFWGPITACPPASPRPTGSGSPAPTGRPSPGRWSPPTAGSVTSPAIPISLPAGRPPRRKRCPTESPATPTWFAPRPRAPSPRTRSTSWAFLR
jgi:uncharacterized protein (DUF885 family)